MWVWALVGVSIYIYTVFQEYEETCLFTQHDSLQANLFEYIPKFIKTPHHSLVVGASPKWGSPMRVGEREPAPRSIILSLLALRSDVSIELALYFISSCLLFLYLHSFFINYCFCNPLITLRSSCAYFQEWFCGC